MQNSLIDCELNYENHLQRLKRWIASFGLEINYFLWLKSHKGTTAVFNLQGSPAGTWIK